MLVVVNVVDYHATIQYICSCLLLDFTDEERAQYGITDNSPTCPEKQETAQHYLLAVFQNLCPQGDLFRTTPFPNIRGNFDKKFTFSRNLVEFWMPVKDHRALMVNWIL